MAAIGTPKLDPDFRARDFFLKSVDGNYYGLDDLRGGAAMLVMFICNHCPYVKAIIGRLVPQCEDLMERYGVRVVAIMPNDTVAYPDDAYDKMVLFARGHKFPFQYLIDESQDVAKSYGAVCTPDFFCFNRDLALRYRGRFDDPKREAVDEPGGELFEAVKHIAATGEAPENQVPSIGCSIKWRCLDDVTN
ncbi:thioredoxin family protein [Candidatus Anaplasma sp. TIGMIC]|uniref:thioredoxin family protein n=1 Tax=Candidatus Anaplasma sp. TIGMIC TaxID=3020713 RepID=UPI0023304101|nr:thioredoxin family protein [Candidatus Anaplasma sp. TIGMIC]MDB1135291.1 thioredoxin family protein [Candidatus Anaplasma sp. TIGMIC]